MVDFKSRLAGGRKARVTDPIGIYETLDRASDKGPLRPAQVAVLNEWYSNRRTDRDVLVKLHTGQGKTLIGLMILQSRLNADSGPALYVCPNNFLVEQTRIQARQFGINTCVAEGDLPDDFTARRAILVVSVQKLFNGLTKFGLDRESILAGTILLDDAHACADAIRQACRIRIPSDDNAYDELIRVFSTDLEQQGVGTYADLRNGKTDARLPVPYWAWTDRESDVARILAAGSDRKSIKFAWPLLKDMLAHCQCVVSGNALEIEPRIPRLEAFGTYWKAEHRVFMSATVTDDAFLVRGLQLHPETITRPVTYPQETWSGEKLVLIPSLIHDDLTQSEVAHLMCKGQNTNFGIVALVPSFSATKLWEANGAQVASTETVTQCVQRLLEGQYSPVLALANRYDGIDLPDDACRVLVLDGKPHSESLVDLYEESCRPDSEATLMRTLRTIEQGFGRSVRGEKDYSVVIVVGPALVRLLREPKSRQHLSAQMNAQVAIGLEVAEMAQEDLAKGLPPAQVLAGLINQCLKRDPDWKQFYMDQMNSLTVAQRSDWLLQTYATELNAETTFYKGDYAGAMTALQLALDSGVLSRGDAGWYLQEIARYAYKVNRVDSQKKQVAAWAKNRLLLRPPEGVTVAKLTLLNQGRMERLRAWVRRFSLYSEMNVAVTDILSSLKFGVDSDVFERGLMELGLALGFAAERPDKEWKEGPDCLWALDDTTYIVWECKSEVQTTRLEINKREAEQMNRSSAWFKKHYLGATVTHFMVHPAKKLETAAALLQETFAVRERHLKELVKAAGAFFKAFETLHFDDLSPLQIQEMINAHGLSNADMLSGYRDSILVR